MKLAPCPFCASPNVKRWFFKHPRRTDPGCEDCKKTTSIQEWRQMVEASELRGGTPVGEADYFPPARAKATASELVDLNDEESLKIWCAELGICDDDLRQAVSVVGPMPNALRFYLRKGLPQMRPEWGGRQRSPRKRQAEDAPAPLNPDGAN